MQIRVILTLDLVGDDENDAIYRFIQSLNSGTKIVKLEREESTTTP